MATQESTTIKQCSKKTECLHPEAVDGWLPATPDYFHRHKNRAGGLSTQCKACVHAYSVNYYQNHQEEERRYSKDRRRINPDRVREIDRKSKSKHRDKVKAREKAYRDAHMPEIIKRIDAYRKNHPEKDRQWKRKYAKSHPDLIREINHRYRTRKRSNGGSHTRDDIKVLLKMQKGKCWWCGGKLSDGQYHVDHRVPLSRGGSNAPENLCIACPKCNRQKGNKLPYEWGDRLL